MTKKSEVRSQKSEWRRLLAEIMAIGLLAASSLFAQSGLVAPRVGFVHDEGGGLVPVAGVRANFLLGRPVMGEVRAAAFSGRFGFAVTQTEVLVLDRAGAPIARLASAADTPLFAFRKDGRPALVYDAATRDLYRWRGDSLARMEWSGEGFAGEPIAIAQPHAGLLAAVERRGDSLWMVRRSFRDGLVRFEAMLPGVSAPVLLGADGTLVYRSLEGLTVRGLDGFERQLPLPVAVAGFEQMGEGWIRVLTAGSAHYALRITAAEARIHRLPGGRQ